MHVLGFIFPQPDLTPLITAAIILVVGGVIGALIWGFSLIVSTHVKYRNRR